MVASFLRRGHYRYTFNMATIQSNVIARRAVARTGNPPGGGTGTSADDGTTTSDSTRDTADQTP